MTKITESEIEEAALAWIEALGWFLAFRQILRSHRRLDPTRAQPLEQPRQDNGDGTRLGSEGFHSMEHAQRHDCG